MKEPRHSCPHFDEALRLIDKFFIKTEEDIDVFDNIKKEIESARSINSELREWGEELEEEKDNFEVKLDDIEIENTKLQNNIYDLESKIKELEEEKERNLITT